MENYQKILQSFETKKTLNPKVWSNPENPKNSKIKPEVRTALLKISEEFIDYLDEEIFVEDIIITGSLSNYNWSEYSDFDLHIKLDFSQFEENADLYQKLFDLKKQIFNEKHDIKIFGYDVELYTQSTEEKHYSTGEYSIQDNEWIKIPKKQKLTIDEEFLKDKITHWTEKINNAVEENNTDKLEKLKQRLKKFRQCGIEEKGEFSYENLVFKYLRRSNMIKKLFDGLNKSLDKKLSVETTINEDFDVFLNKIKELLKSLGIKTKEAAKPVVQNFLKKEKSNQPIRSDGKLSYLDLNTQEGYNAYRDICQEFIDSRNPDAGVTGDMMAISAKRFISKGYIPPELALAQLALEGGLSKDEKNRPRRTNNPFNVGNVDSGKNRYFDSIQEGIDAYYDLMSRNYVTKGKSAEELLSNFVNKNNRRYATDPAYETKLEKIVGSISSISQPIIAKYQKNQPTLA